MDTDPACQDAIFDEFLPACANLGAQRATFYNVLILLIKFKYHKNRFAHDILSIMAVCYRNCFPFVRQNRRLTGEVRENGLASLREELYISRCCWNLDLTQRDYDDFKTALFEQGVYGWNLDLTQRDYDPSLSSYNAVSLCWNLDLTQRDYDALRLAKAFIMLWAACWNLDLTQRDYDRL